MLTMQHGAMVSAPPRDVFRLAAEASIDPRTAKKALTDGLGAIRGELVRERIRRAMAVLGMTGAAR